MAAPLENQPFKRKGDKENSEFFEKYLLEIYKKRKAQGLEELIGHIHHFLIQVELGKAKDLIAEKLLHTPFLYHGSFEHEAFRYHILRVAEQTPDLLIREPKVELNDNFYHLNMIAPKGRHLPHTRYIGEAFGVSDLKQVYQILYNQNQVQFQEALSENPAKNFTAWTHPSTFTNNCIGYIEYTSGEKQYQKDNDWNFDDETIAKFKLAKDMFKTFSLEQYVGPIDHFATRVYSHDREHAILEYLSLSNYWFWGAYNIGDQNSSTNVCRNLQGLPESQSPAKVFTANNTPFYVNHIDNLPCPTENFVRNYGRRLHHIAYGVKDGFIGAEENNHKNVDYVVDQLKKAHMKFLDHVIGSCEEGLKQIFSQKSKSSLLITEYIQRCDQFDGFFTKENVAALTQAAGLDDLIT